MEGTKVLLIGNEDGLTVLRSADNGKTWSEPDVQMPGVHVCAIEPAGDAVYLGTRGSGLFKGSGALKTWQAMGLPREATKIRSLRHVGGGLLVGTEPIGVYRLSDAGAWETVGDVTRVSGAGEWFYPVPKEEPHVRHISVDRRNPDVMYTALQVGGVGITRDGGSSWHDVRSLNLDVHMIEPSGSQEGVVFAGTGGEGLYRSEDCGETWEPSSDGCGNFVVQFAVDPTDSKRMFLGTGRGGPREWRDTKFCSGELFRSEDGAKSWRRVGGGLPQPLASRISVLTIDSADPAKVYFGAGFRFGGTNVEDSGVYESHDHGDSWRRVARCGEPDAVAAVRI